MNDIEKEVVEEYIRLKEIKKIKQYLINIECIVDIYNCNRKKDENCNRNKNGIAIHSEYIKNKIKEFYEKSIEVNDYEYNKLEKYFKYNEQICYDYFRTKNETEHTPEELYNMFIKELMFNDYITNGETFKYNSSLFHTCKCLSERLQELTNKTNPSLIKQIVLKELKSTYLFDEIWLNSMLVSYI